MAQTFKIIEHPVVTTVGTLFSKALNNLLGKPLCIMTVYCWWVVASISVANAGSGVLAQL